MIGALPEQGGEGKAGAAPLTRPKPLDEERDPLGFGSYLRFLALPGGIALVGIAAAYGISAALGLPRDAVILQAALLVACALLAAAVASLRRRRFFAELADAAATLERPWEAPALLDPPSSPEGSSALGSLELACRSAGAAVADAQEERSRYRAYVEQWIHEVKAPLAAAQLMAARSADPESDALAAELARIEERVEQALWFARATTLRADFEIREVSLAEAARACCRRTARLLIERGARPRIDLSDERVLADAKQLGFMLTQLVVNAAKYGARTIRFSAWQEGDQASARTVLEVADDGCGIPAQDVPRVFDRGFTGRNGRAVAGSTGMGLYLCALMCDSLGLGIRLGSEEGKGTWVRISFPHDRRRLDLERGHM